MKTRLLTLLLLTALLLALTGCSFRTVEATLDTVEDRADVMMDRIENTVEQHTTGAALPAAQPPHSDKLSRENAEQLALAHAGLSAAEVNLLHTEFDVDDGVPEYDVQFRVDGFEYDYEIHAETGDILKAEKEWGD